MTFEMFEASGQGLNSQKDSYSDNPFQGGGIQFPTSILGGVAGEQLLSRFGGSVGESILGKIGGAYGGFAITSLITSGVGADVFKRIKDNFGYNKGMECWRIWLQPRSHRIQHSEQKSRQDDLFVYAFQCKDIVWHGIPRRRFDCNCFGYVHSKKTQPKH
jgi:hypothetical protein